MKKITTRIVTHTIAWAIFICIPFFFTPPIHEKPNIWIILVPWIYAIGFYYLNFYYLTPVLLFRKRAILYLIIILVLTVFFVFIPDLLLRFFTHRIPVQTIKVNIALGRMAFFLSFLVIFIISSGISILNELYRYQYRQHQIELEKSRAELAYLHAQVNPHFLFNTLYSIYHLSMNQSELAPKAILKLSDIMRFIFHESTQSDIPIEKELEIISQYIDLQKLRIPEKTKVIFEISNQNPGMAIAPLILIPIVENAFKYGISTSIETSIEIRIVVEKSRIIFNTYNRKTVSSKEIKGHQTGLKNIETRLNLLYPGKHSFIIDDKPDSFAVNLTMTL